MKKVVITGVTGFIGSALAKRLLQSKVTVYGVGRNISRLNELAAWGDFVPVVVDFEQYEALHTQINDSDLDMFWHFAWQGIPHAYDDYNIQIQNIKIACDAARASVELRCKKSTFCSSYSQEKVALSSGKESVNPDIYGSSKKCALNMFKAILYKCKIPCSNIILPNVYGAGDKLNSAIVFFIRNLLEDKPLRLISGDYKDDWIDINNLVDGIICAANSGDINTDYYIGNRAVTTFREKLISMKSALSSKSELLFGSYPQNNYVDYSQFDLDALYNDTGFEVTTSFAESIRETADWIKSIS